MARFSLLLSLLFFHGLLYSIDWEVQKTGVSETLRDVCFIDSLLGWAVGDNGTILHTNDGGTNWVPQTSQTHRTLWRVQFLDPQNGFITADIHSGHFDFTPEWLPIYLSTTDGGQTWNCIETNLSRLYCLHFTSPDTGWIGGYTYKTEDNFHQSAIHHTTNGGATWQPDTIITNNPHDLYRDIVDITMQNSLTGWALGKNYQFIDPFYLFSFRSSGRAWNRISERDDNRIPGFADELIIVSKDTLWACSRTYLDELAYSFDAGFHWHNSYPIGYQDDKLRDILPSTGKTVWLLFEKQLVLLKDIGNTFSMYKDESFTKYALAGDGRHFLWIVGSGGKIVKVDIREISTNVSTQANTKPPFMGINTYPNPGNSQITITYNLAHAGFAKASVFDLKGRKIKSLCNNHLPPGEHRMIWNGTNESNEPIPSGIYLIVLETSTYTQHRKISIIN